MNNKFSCMIWNITLHNVVYYICTLYIVHQATISLLQYTDIGYICCMACIDFILDEVYIMFYSQC